MNRPLVIAHRGASAHAPENTLSSFQQAIEAGADGIELDVWRCASGEVVVTHNRDLEILTGRPGDVEQKSLKELRRYDFGAFKDKSFRGEKIPTLQDVLELARGMALINVEVKGTNLRGNGIEIEVIEAILDFKLLRKVVVSSFNPTILMRVQAVNPAIHTGLLLYEKSPLPLRRGWSARFLNNYSLHPSFALLKKSMVEKTHLQKKRVIVWTINDPGQLDACMECGVDGMITDDPAWMLNALHHKN